MKTVVTITQSVMTHLAVICAHAMLASVEMDSHVQVCVYLIMMLFFSSITLLIHHIQILMNVGKGHIIAVAMLCALTLMAVTLVSVMMDTLVMASTALVCY